MSFEKAYAVWVCLYLITSFVPAPSRICLHHMEQVGAMGTALSVYYMPFAIGVIYLKDTKLDRILVIDRFILHYRTIIEKWCFLPKNRKVLVLNQTKLTERSDVSVQIWRMIDLIYRPAEEVLAELDKFKSHILACEKN